ncbi:MAG: hypothetical protein GWP05_01940 [Anaerolineaceae bacterium]|nr:hypothetical protein [Anaerolineaceae bacterium]
MNRERGVRHWLGRLMLSGAMAACLVGLAGCKPDLQPQEFLSRRDVLAIYNARAAAITRLWSKCRIEVRMPKFNADPADPRVTGYDTYSADGHFVFTKPRNLFLQGKAPFVGPVFGLHSNDRDYWFWVKPKDSVEYRGRYGGPGQDKLFLRPDRLLEALGLFAVPADGRAMFRRDDEADVIQVLAKSPPQNDLGQGFSSLYVAKEIHLDRFKHDPVEVRLLSPSGDPLVISQLEDYREIDGRRVPTRLTFRFLFAVPARSEATVTLKLKRVSLTKEINPRLFVYNPSPVEHFVDLDAEDHGDKDKSADDSAE